MKKLVIMTAIVALTASMAYAQGGRAGDVLNTMHNLSSQSTVPGQTINANGTVPNGGQNEVANEVCVFCHTPHNANASNPNPPLWNHETTGQTFTVYTSGTMEAAPLAPRNSSVACLSCHDGVTAVGSLTYIYQATVGGGTMGMNGVGGSGEMIGNANVGTDLSNDHPISFVYATHQAADASLAVGTTALKDASYFPAPALGNVNDLLYNDGSDLYVECSSCHFVHGHDPAITPTQPVNTYDPLLTVSKYDSDLCTSCHIK